MIYFAVEEGEVLATCMAKALGNNVWEFCKLEIAQQYTEKGAQSAVFKGCMDYAIGHGARKLTLISNPIFKPASHIYNKFGFKEISFHKEYWKFQRADIAFEYIVIDLTCYTFFFVTEDGYSQSSSFMKIFGATIIWETLRILLHLNES